MSASPPVPDLAERIAGFLRLYAPFSYLTPAQRFYLGGLVNVRYYAAQSPVFSQGENPAEEFYVVYKGAVRLFRNDGGEELVDQLDEGDLFGIRPLMARQAYELSARTTEETLLYAIPIKQFELVLDDNPRVARYLASSFASNHTLKEFDSVGIDGLSRPLSAPEPLKPTLDVLMSAEMSRVPTRRAAVLATLSESIRVVAQRMTAAGVGSLVIVNENELPIGLVTDRDLRKLVVAGGLSSEAQVSEIMQSPPFTIAPDQSVVDVQLSMVRYRVHHLIVTLDGTPHSRVLGVISNRDLLLALGSSPAAIAREIRSAKSVEQLKALRLKADRWLRSVTERRGSVYAAASIMTELNDEVTRSCLELARLSMVAQGIEAPTLAYCWLCLGSQARGEQLLRTDQDHAIVLADAPREELIIAREYFVRFADEASRNLEFIGYERCQGDMMASNPAWCLSLSEWKLTLRDWTINPTGEKLLNASTLLDRRPLYGDLALGQTLVDVTAKLVLGERLFLAFLAKAAIDNPPPLSFFRSFVVERSGEHKDAFDIKQRAMLPLADAARVLSLELGISDPPNTVTRFDRLRAAEPQNAELFEAAAQAYDTLMQFRARQGLSQGNEGRYFQVNKLGKLERLQLRNAFGPIEKLLDVLKLRFQITLLTQ